MLCTQELHQSVRRYHEHNRIWVSCLTLCQLQITSNQKLNPKSPFLFSLSPSLSLTHTHHVRSCFKQVIVSPCVCAVETCRHSDSHRDCHLDLRGLFLGAYTYCYIPESACLLLRPDSLCIYHDQGHFQPSNHLSLLQVAVVFAVMYNLPKCSVCKTM